MFNLYIDNVLTQQFKELEYTDSLLELTQVCQVVLTNNENERPPIKYNSTCMLYYKDTLLMYGYVDSLKIQKNTQGSLYLVTFRNFTQDLIDSYHETKTFPKNTRLRTIVKNLGFNCVAEDGVNDLLDIEIQHLAGSRIFQLLLNQAKNLGIILNSIGDTVHIKNINSSFTPILTINNHEIINSTLTYNNNENFGVIKMFSNGSAEDENVFEVELKNENYRAVRKYIGQSQEPLNNKKQLQKACEWQRGILNAKSFIYNLTLNNFEKEDVFFNTNNFYHIVDDNIGIDSVMFCKSIKMNLDNSGKRTSLELLKEDAYSSINILNSDKQGVNYYE